MSRRVEGVVGREVIDRLLRFRSVGAPVVSVYLAIPVDPGELRGLQARVRSLLRPVRELAEARDLSHSHRESLRRDLDRALAVASRAREFQGRAVAVFACGEAGLFEVVDLPRRVRDRVEVDASPYLRPMLLVLEEFRRYCVVVVDRARAWLFEFCASELEEATQVFDEGSSERRAPNRAEHLARRHFRRTAELAEELVRRTGAELLVLGGHADTVAEFQPFLPHGWQDKVAGTFVIDPHTMTPALVREKAHQVVSGYERDEQARLVREALERVPAGGLAAVGLEWCLAATNAQAVQLLLIHDEEMAPGRASDTCGWLGLDGDQCPVCGEPTRKAPDVIEEMSAAVIDAGGHVKQVSADTDLSPHVVAALLRFPVREPVRSGDGK